MADTATLGTIEHIDPTQIEVEINIRTTVKLDPGFVASIREHGVITPVGCRRTGDGTVTVRIGQRRVLAARAVGLATIPAYIVEGDDSTVERLLEQFVENEQRAEHVVATALGQLGGIDVVFNNAGIIRRTTATETTVEEWDRVFAVNVRAIFLMCKHVVPIMTAAGGGSIVNTGSGWGLKGGARALSYCASKGAVVNMTRALAIDHGPDGIRVNSVNPGDVDTGMLRDEARQLGQAELGFLAEAAVRPLNRMGQPSEVAAAVVWLASDASSYVTGSALVVDGGGIA